ncbi:hypothetical protein [Paraburkholderia kururiensis]|uniref:hypothetical protein n=1 Tax=Paraburkholderia kururiensis TaxID=984307 RepID=UPI000F889050|nr:hypothetical protein [Paraburkholderia kururiensis]
MHRYLDFQAASRDLAVGVEFDDLPSFHQGKVVSDLMTRLFDQLDEFGRRATVHEWEYFGYATTLLMQNEPKEALDRLREVCVKQEVDYPGGGHTDQLRQALNCAIDVRRN